jgi:hypothetical protein
MVNFGQDIINTTVTRNTDWDPNDKCYCHIHRLVRASVNRKPELDPTYFDCFLNIIITAQCHKHWISDSKDATANPGYSTFHSFKITPCYSLQCRCGPDTGLKGNKLNSGGICIANLTKMWSSHGDDPDSEMPQWAKDLVGGKSATEIGETIHTEEQLGGINQDQLNFGPYFDDGHPKCSAIEGKHCCVPLRKEFGQH